jgi:hypothetical protein
MTCSSRDCSCPRNGASCLFTRDNIGPALTVLLDRVADRRQAGRPDLDVVLWALEFGVPTWPVLEILAALDTLRDGAPLPERVVECSLSLTTGGFAKLPPVKLEIRGTPDGRVTFAATDDGLLWWDVADGELTEEQQQAARLLLLLDWSDCKISLNAVTAILRLLSATDAGAACGCG